MQSQTPCHPITAHPPPIGRDGEGGQIDEAAAERLLRDDDWWVQPSLAGRRVLVRKRGGDVRGVDLDGRPTALPEPIVTAVRAVAAGSCLLDGVVAGDGVYHAFDLLERDGADLPRRPYALRYDGALDLVDAVPSDALRFAPTASTTRAKLALFARLARDGDRGVVFKHRAAPLPVDAGGDPAGATPTVLTFVGPARRAAATRAQTADPAEHV